MEFVSKYVMLIDVGGVGFEVFVVVKNLRGIGSGYGGKEEIVVDVVFFDLFFEVILFLEIVWFDILYVEL